MVLPNNMYILNRAGEYPYLSYNLYIKDYFQQIKLRDILSGSYYITGTNCRRTLGEKAQLVGVNAMVL